MELPFPFTDAGWSGIWIIAPARQRNPFVPLVPITVEPSPERSTATLSRSPVRKPRPWKVGA